MTLISRLEKMALYEQNERRLTGAAVDWNLLDGASGVHYSLAQRNQRWRLRQAALEVSGLGLETASLALGWARHKLVTSLASLALFGRRAASLPPRPPTPPLLIACSVASH